MALLRERDGRSIVEQDIVSVGSRPLVNYALCATNRVSVNMTATNLNNYDFNSTNYSMAGAYVLIASEIGYETIIIDEIMAIPQAVEACKVYGATYDIIVKISADSPEKLRRILSSIRRVEKIKSTQTMLIAEDI
jgi:DNA-binding Lrp family transcriptional regulator